MRTLTILAALWVSSAWADSSGQSYFTRFAPSRWRQVAYESYLKQDLRTGVSVFRLSPTDLLSLTGRYGYEVTDRNMTHFYRTDRWRIGFALSPGTLLTGAGAPLPVQITLNAGREIVFTRPFSTKTQALTALPRTPLELPFTAERALRLAPGEFVSLPVDMGLALSAGYVGRYFPWKAGANAGFLWAGEFRINLFKETPTRLRVKVVPSQTDGPFAGASAGLDLDLFGYGPMGLVNWDDQAEKLLGLDFFRFHHRWKAEGEQFCIDYVLDLTDPRAAQAYEDLIAGQWTLSPVYFAKQLKGRGRLEELTLGLLTPLEALSDEDHSLPQANRRVERAFWGANQYQSTATGAAIGTRLLRFQHQRGYQLNDLRLSDPEGEKRYLYPVVTRDEETRSFFTPWREEERFRADAAFEKKDGITHFRGVRFRWQIVDRRFWSLEGEPRRRRAQAFLGPTAYRDLGVAAGWPTEGGKKFSARFEAFFAPHLFWVLALQAEYSMAFSGWLTQWAQSTGQKAAALRLVKPLLRLRSGYELWLIDQWFQVIGSSESAQELLAGLLTELGHHYHAPPVLRVEMQVGAAQPFLKKSGEPLQNDGFRAIEIGYTTLSHTGYPYR